MDGSIGGWLDYLRLKPVQPPIWVGALAELGNIFYLPVSALLCGLRLSSDNKKSTTGAYHQIIVLIL